MARKLVRGRQWQGAGDQVRHPHTLMPNLAALLGHPLGNSVCGHRPAAWMALGPGWSLHI